MKRLIWLWLVRSYSGVLLGGVFYTRGKQLDLIGWESHKLSPIGSAQTMTESAARVINNMNQGSTVLFFYLLNKIQIPTFKA